MKNERSSTRLTVQKSETQEYATVINRPIALDPKVRLATTANLNQILTNSTFCSTSITANRLRLSTLWPNAFKRWAESQSRWRTMLPKRHIARPPRVREHTDTQLFRMLQAHELIIDETREFARTAAAGGDDRTNDLLIGDVLRINEFQVWFISEQLAGSGIAGTQEDSALMAVAAHA